MNFDINIERMRADRVGPPPLPAKQQQQVNLPDKPSFAQHLKEACEEIGVRTQFSKHATERVESREIDLSREQLVRIEKAVDTVEDKGAKRALVMLDDMALIIGLDQRKVITMVSSEEMRQNVFTKIDAAVVA